MRLRVLLIAALAAFASLLALAVPANAADYTESTDVGNVDLGADGPTLAPKWFQEEPGSTLQPVGSDGESIIELNTDDPNATVQDSNGIWVPWHSCKISPQIPSLDVYPSDHVITSGYTSCNRSTATESYVQLQYTDANGVWRNFGTAHKHGDANPSYWTYKSAACAYPSRSRWWRTKAWVDWQAISASGIWDRNGPHYSYARWIGHCR